MADPEVFEIPVLGRLADKYGANGFRVASFSATIVGTGFIATNFRNIVNAQLRIIDSPAFGGGVFASASITAINPDGTVDIVVTDHSALGNGVAGGHPQKVDLLCIGYQFVETEDRGQA